MITLDVHNIAAFQNTFRRPTMHLGAPRLFVPVIRVPADPVAISVQ
ncbi:MAG: hypothetical protein WA975_21225 [Mesorhizobium sp.]